MSTVIITRGSMWDRTVLHLKTWGMKAGQFAKKTGNWIARMAKWAYNSKPVQWVATAATFAGTKVKVVGLKAWSLVRGPVLWIGAPIAAVIFAPKAVAVMLVLTMITVGVLAWYVRKLYKGLQENGYLDGWEKDPDTPYDQPRKSEEPKDEEPKDIVDAIIVEDGEKVEVHVSDEDQVKILVEDAMEGVEPPPEVPTEVLPINLEPTADEDINDRYGFLEDQRDLAMAMDDVKRYSDLTGRVYLLEVRSNKDKAGKLKADASANMVYRECRRICESLPGTYPWEFKAMSDAVRSEDKRLKDIKALKAEQDSLASV